MVLLTSGYTDNIIAGSINQGSGVALLSKPYLPGELLEKVREIFDIEGE